MKANKNQIPKSKYKKLGYSVVLFQKEAYPFHKVCGEYVSLESWDFLASLGIPLQDLKLPLIDTLCLTAPNGNSFITKLPQGGFGISRYLLDDLLAQSAIANGVHVLQKTKVDDVIVSDVFTVHFHNQIVKAKVCCAAYGKRSNLDLKWNRGFLKQQNNLTQWLRIIKVIKNAVVQMVESRFMRKLFLKSAAASSFQTLLIQYRKNDTTGNRNNKNKKKWFRFSWFVKRKYIASVAKRNNAMLKTNVPFFRNR